jgi:hypothetical protein
VETRGIEPLTSTLQRRITRLVSCGVRSEICSEQVFCVHPVRSRPYSVDQSVHLVCTWLDKLRRWRRS